MRQALLLIALAGCGAHNPAVCSKQNPCDDGFVCDYTDPEGPTCINADGDLDGDGIPNGEDFCEHAPGGQYDEDGDGIGDDCDPCPIAPPPAVPDADGDDVDSPCDPDPRTPGDKIVAFSGFHTIPDTWKLRTPSAWVIDDGDPVKGGQVTVRSPDSAPETLTIPVPIPSNTIAVLTAYRVDQVDGGTQHDIGVIAADPRPAGGTTLICGGERTTNGDFVFVTTSQSASNKPLTDLFNTSSVYDVVVSTMGTQTACALVGDQDMGAVQASISGDSLSQAGLSVHGATARFGYILVIARTP